MSGRWSMIAFYVHKIYSVWKLLRPEDLSEYKGP